MALSLPLALLPEDAREVNDRLAVQESEEGFVFFNAAGPVCVCRKDDPVSLRLAAQNLIDLELVGVAEIASILGVHRTTLFRDGRRMDAEGVGGLGGKRRGPRGPRLLTGTALKTAQGLLNRGMSMRAAATEIGVSEGTIRKAVRDGRLVRAGSPATSLLGDPAPEAVPPGPASRAAKDQACEPGVGVKRILDRGLARMGMLEEAAPEFHSAEAVGGAGVLLALPALLQEGLLDVGEEVYGRMKNGFFGLRAILLTLAFMALLRLRTPEQLTGHAPGEFGLLLGLDRAPEVKTLRRKLNELGERRLAHECARVFTERWANAEPEEIGLLYVDGHVRTYNGRAHTLPKLFVQQRGRPMPGTEDFHVNDCRGDPLFFVTAPATEGLLEMLDLSILPQIRALMGSDRRVTITFDREGWSPKSFAKWKAQGFDVLTYRKGKQSRWQTRFFETVTGEVEGRRVEYRLAERTVKLSNGLPVREVRRLTDDGHQTAVITTDETLPTLDAAYWMFGRWRQENFFRYMEQEFDLNHMCTNDVEAANPDRMVPSPDRAALTKKLAAARRELRHLMDKLLDLKPGKRARVGKRHLDAEELDAEIAKREAEIRRLSAARKKLPKEVPIKTVMDPDKVVMLERERKVFTDLIKLTAYRAESALFRLLGPLFARHEEEGRKLLKSAFQATADILPDARARTLTIRFHGLSSPRATRALAGLCVGANEMDVAYPGTDLRLCFEAPGLQK